MRYNRLFVTFCALLVLVVLPVKQALAIPYSLDQAASLPSETVFTQTFRSIAEQDGWVLESSETSGQGGLFSAAGATIRVGDNVQDRQYRSVVSFNTASLPDQAVIVSATLRLKKQGGEGTDPFTTHGKLLADIRKPFFGSLAALEAGDFQAAAGPETAGAVSAVLVDGYHLATLVNPALAYLNRTGLTQLRLRFQLDDNDDLNADYLYFYSGDATDPDFRPRLEIKYHLPAVATPTRTRTLTATTNPCEPTRTITPTLACFDCSIPAAVVSSSSSCATLTSTITRTPTRTPNPCEPTITVTPTAPCFDCDLPRAVSSCPTATQTATRTPTRTVDPCEPTITVTPTAPCFDCDLPRAVSSCPTTTQTATPTVTPTHEPTSTPTVTPTENPEVLTPTITQTPTQRCFDC